MSFIARASNALARANNALARNASTISTVRRFSDGVARVASSLPIPGQGAISLVSKGIGKLDDYAQKLAAAKPAV